MNSGARMLPFFCPADAVSGEREVFRLLQNDPGASAWTVLHSLDLAEHIRLVQSEADFVVLIPGAGILVLEVKSHYSIRFDGYGWWLGNALEPESRGPFRQASEAMHSIRDYLVQRGVADSIPMASAVVFPNATFSVSSLEWQPWQVLDRYKLHARPISTSLLQIIEQARRHLATKGSRWAIDQVDVSREKWDGIANTLRPRFEILASPTARRKLLDTNLLYCTEQQCRFLDSWLDNDRMLVTGLAGTGKTVLAMEAVRRVKATNPAAVVGFFCYNKFLGKKLEEECRGLGKSVRVGGFHRWMASIAGITGGEEQSDNPAFWNQILPERVLGLLTSPGTEGGFLDYLVLDEAQDLFLESYLDIFDLLLQGGIQKGRWLFMGDFERQNIYCPGAVSKTDFYGRRADKRCALFKLNENCRNTPEISYTLTMLAGLNPGYSRVIREDTRHDPELLFYNDLQEQEILVCVALDRVLGEGFKPSDILLLSPSRENALGQRLSMHPSWKGRLREYQRNMKIVTYCTIHAFKGLESPVVILTDIRDMDHAKRMDLFYIGMSRALHRLIVLCHKSSEATLKEMLL